MTTATQNLENDHMHILRLIGVMERIIVNGNPNIEHLETIVKVIREFADGLHHAKEEQLLFPLMVQKGFLKRIRTRCRNASRACNGTKLCKRND